MLAVPFEGEAERLQQCAHVRLRAPQERGLKALGRPRHVTAKPGEHLPELAFGRPAAQPHGAAGTADASQLACRCGVIWGEHVPEGRGHDVERVIVEGQLSRVTDHPLHLDSRLRCAVASGGEPGVGDV